MAKQSKTSRLKLGGLLLEEQAVRLRLTGATYSQIGKALGCAKQSAHAAVTRAMKRSKQKTGESMEQLRQIELHRLDALTMAMWPKAQKGDTRAVLAIEKLMKRRAMMMGLDAPKQSEHTIGGDLEVVAPQMMNFGKVTIEF